jgi:hypothetical protein
VDIGALTHIFLSFIIIVLGLASAHPPHESQCANLALREPREARQPAGRLLIDAHVHPPREAQLRLRRQARQREAGILR